MTEASTSLQTDQILDFLIDLTRYRRHILAMLPEDILRRKERLAKLCLGDETRRAADRDMFRRVGVILSRHQEPMPMGEFSKALEVPLSTATRIVDGLVEGGLVQRVADPGDRRVVRVTWTPDGREFYQAMDLYMRQSIDRLLRSFTSEEREQFIRLLGKIVVGLKENAN